MLLKGSSFQKADLGRCLYILQQILFHIQFAESLYNLYKDTNNMFK
jgi:hypothetical protein